MRGQSHGSFGELSFAFLFEAGKDLVDQKTAGRKDFDELLLDLTHLQFAGGLDQCRTQIKLRLFSVEAGERLNQRGRNDQDRVRVAQRIADQKARAVLDRRGHEIQIAAKTRQWRRHPTIVTNGALHL